MVLGTRNPDGERYSPSPVRRLLAFAVLVLITACGPRTAPSATPEWKTIAELDQPRAYASAIALANGKILVVGGFDRSVPDIMNGQSELIDPATGKVTLLPQRLLGRIHQSITSGWDDLVVVAGGVEWLEGYWSPVNRVDVYRPSRREWVQGAPLRHPRSDHAAAALQDGRILVTGGNADTKLMPWSEIYNPRTDTWTEAAPMPRARTQHSAVTLYDGRVLVAGGLDFNGAATNTTFMYDPRTDSWTDGPLMTDARNQRVVVALPNGDVLLAGGNGVASGTSEIYRWTEGRFVPSGTLVPAPRRAGCGTPRRPGRSFGGLPLRMHEFSPLRTLRSGIRRPALERPAPAPTPRAWGTSRRPWRHLSALWHREGEIAYRTIERCLN